MEAKNSQQTLGAKPKNTQEKSRLDRLERGKIKLSPKEAEKDVKTKPPDATIVVDGIKYQVKKKGKVKNPKTEDGLYHNKNKPPESRKKLEKALLAWAVLCILTPTAVSINVTQWNLNDNSTIRNIHSAMYERKINRSLHGIWPLRRCTGIPSKTVKDYELEGIVGMLDSSPRTNFTCCRLQRHEWNKHGWCNWGNVTEWIELMNSTQANLTLNNVTKECAVTCRYDERTGLNIVLQARDTPSKLTGCKKNKNFSFSGEVRIKPCNFEVDIVDLMMEEEYEIDSTLMDLVVDQASEAVEKARRYGFQIMSWIEETASKKKKIFGAQASPYCNITRIVGDVVYTNNCTPACLPGTTTIIGPGKFNLNGKNNLHPIPIESYHIGELTLLGLIFLSDYAPETASITYLALHFFCGYSEHPKIGKDCDESKLNITMDLPVSDLVPSQLYLLGEWNCIKPGWWPVMTRAEEIFTDIITLLNLLTRAIAVLTTIFSEATAIAYMALIIKVLRGQPIHGLLWLLIITGTEANPPKNIGIKCREEFEYALASSTEIAPTQTAKDLITMWETKDLSFGALKLHCDKNNDWIMSNYNCVAIDVYLLEAHVRQVMRNPKFIKIIDHKTITDEPIKKYGVCPCGATPKEESNFKSMRPNGPAFMLICPRGWKGSIDCYATQEHTWKRTLVHKFSGEFNMTIQGEDCSATRAFGNKQFHCRLGGGASCQKGRRVTFNRDKIDIGLIKFCKWCGFEFTTPTLKIPNWPMGECYVKGFNGTIEGSKANCTQGCTKFSTQGTTECKLGGHKVKVLEVCDTLEAMPCEPILTSSYRGDVQGKMSCTFNYSKVLKNKYYDKRDEFWQQYIVKDGYQYWFDLEATDNRPSYFAEFLVLIIVLLLGGKTTAWLVVAVYLLNNVRVQAIPLLAKSYMFSTTLAESNLETLACFVILLCLLLDKEGRDIILTIFYVLTTSALNVTIFTFLVVIGYARGEDGSNENYSYVVILTLGVVFIAVKLKSENVVILGILVICLRVSGMMNSVAMLLVITPLYLVMLVYYKWKWKRWIILVLNCLWVVSLIEVLKAIPQFTPQIKKIPNLSCSTFLICYLAILSSSLKCHYLLDAAFSLFPAIVINYLLQGVDILTILIANPWYETAKYYYLKRRNSETSKEWELEEGRPLEDISSGKEGVYQLPSKSRESNPHMQLILLICRSLILTMFGSYWKPLMISQCLIELIYWVHIKIVRELAGVTNFFTTAIAIIIQINWVFDSTEETTEKKKYLLCYPSIVSKCHQLKELIMKHKVENDTVRNWFNEEEVFGMPKTAWLLKISNLTQGDAIVCTVCENRQIKDKCPKCRSEKCAIKCGMTLSQLEEKYYNKIYIHQWETGPDCRVEEPGKIVRYYNEAKLYLRNLPILATKNKLMIVGNLGNEICDLESLGWVLRGPAVCKKIVNCEHTKTSLLDKLTAFFGIMPRGSTPRAPVRFPRALLKIKRGFETGWAYTHNGGISSVHHVTAGKDLFVSDSMGRTRVVCQSSSQVSDEVEYGVKTDSSCPDGTRCYVINPEATNIAGTTGAMVHLRKVGSEYSCVTAMGTPAYYNLQNLKGWSGLPIFEASTGKVVGRVKAGKNEGTQETTIMSGVQSVQPIECNIESLAKKIAVMTRGEFKQITLATGAGKTTELPRQLIENVGRHKRVLVLIPLRAAAEGVYRYMQTKHPSISFHLRVGEMKEGDMATGITYASYGYFCQYDFPKLKAVIQSYNYVFLDEFHCATPEQLALISLIHRFSEGVRAIAMSATPPGTVAKIGQKFPIDEVQVPHVLKGEDLAVSDIEVDGMKIKREEFQNNVLIFVPTKRLATEIARKLASEGVNAAYYFSGEDPSSLRTTVAKSPYTVVATNAIESGVTLPDLDTVIDTCMKCEKRIRINNKAPYIVTGLKRMAITTAEQAQRRGRVGRVKPGRYLRPAIAVGGEKDYHYDLLQAQMYGLQSGINITKSFREMNYDWSLYEMDVLMVSQLEVLNNLLLMKEMPIVLKNLLSRTTHPEPIQLVYNYNETPVPVLFPIVKNGEVTNKFETYELMSCRKLDNDVPSYIYATEDEDLAVDLLDLKWPDPNQPETIEAQNALNQLAGLSTGETALMVALLGWVGYQALTKRHVPVVVSIYEIEDEKLEDTTHLQYAPDSLATGSTRRDTELKDLNQHDIEKIVDKGKQYSVEAFKYLKRLCTSTGNNLDKETMVKEGENLWKKFRQYLLDNEADITKYGLWGVHSALYKSITERLGSETAFASLVIKWLAFSNMELPSMVKQAAVDLVVFYLMNKPEYRGDQETQKEGRKFVAGVLISALATYTFNNYSKDKLKQLVEPALAYLPYGASLLGIFTPTKLESVVILSTSIYKTYLAIKRGQSNGMLGLAISSAMEIMSQNPVSVAIAVALGVGAIAAHNAIESCEVKRTLLMKVFVKNFLDQAATDELMKENPETIIMAMFEAVQTVGNPIRLIYHIYGMAYKGWSAKEIANKTAGRNLFVLTMFEGLEMLGLDDGGKWRNLSTNYLVDLIQELIRKIQIKFNSVKEGLIRRMLPAPFSCRTHKQDCRIGWQQKEFDEFIIKCPCGYIKRGRKVHDKIEILSEEGPSFCRNSGVAGMNNIHTTTYIYQNEEVGLCASLEGQGDLTYKQVSVTMDFNHNRIIATDQWELGHRFFERLMTDYTGISYGEAYLGDKPYPNNKKKIPRHCATITSNKVAFIKLERGCAYTENLELGNILQLIHQVHKLELTESNLPEKTGENWINIKLINEELGTIKPRFGEIVVPDEDEIVEVFGPEVRINNSNLQVTTPQGERTGRVAGVSYELTANPGTDKPIIDLGFEPKQVPGPLKQSSKLVEEIVMAANKPYVLLIGNIKNVSNRAKTCRGIEFLRTKKDKTLLALSKSGELIVIQIGSNIQEELRGAATYVVPYLTKDLLLAFYHGKSRSTSISRRQARILVNSSGGEVEDVPEWFQDDNPKFLDIQTQKEMYRLVGNLESLKEKANNLGIPPNVKVQKQTERGQYFVKLSTWWESERLSTLSPLFQELMLMCKPTTRYRQCHYVSAEDLARGNWEVVAPEVNLGRVPAVKKKIFPYEAYILFKNLITTKGAAKCENEIKKHNEWILNRIVEPGTLNLKYLVSPGKVAQRTTRDRRKWNIYNKRITSVMNSVGIRLQNLPIVRAQVDTKTFHQSIREKIDKQPNKQTPGLHKELMDVFEACKCEDAKNQLDEVTWEELEVGINRKGAAGFFEQENIGEVIATKKNKVESLINQLKRGKFVEYYETAIPKNEKREVLEDWLQEDFVQEKKPRVIQYPEAKMRLAITKVLYSWVKQKKKLIPGYEGKTPIFQVFDKVKREWDQFHKPVAVSFDTKAWDTQVTPEDLGVICEIQKYYYKKKWHKFIDTITEHMKQTPVVTEDGDVYIREGQRGSGQPDTSAGNSMLNVLTMIYAFCKANNIPYRAFNKVARIHVCGDDGFLITEKELGLKFAEFGYQILYEAGKPQKIQEGGKMKISTKFEDIEFCSHTPIAVRWRDGTVSYAAGRDTAIILSKMSTRLDSTNEKGNESYEKAVAFSFLLLYFWNPIIRRIALLVLSSIDSTPSNTGTIYTYRGDPIGAFEQVYGRRLDQLDRTDFSKLSQLNTSMSLLNIWGKNTSKRLLEDCVKIAKLVDNPILAADRTVSKNVGKVYEGGRGQFLVGTHYEEIILERQPIKNQMGIERYVPGPIKRIVTKRLRIIEMFTV